MTESELSRREFGRGVLAATLLPTLPAAAGPAYPDLPAHMTAACFEEMGRDARARLLRIKPDTALRRYSIDALEVWADGMDRMARGEGTFDGQLSAIFKEQLALTHVHGVDP